MQGAETGTTWAFGRSEWYAQVLQLLKEHRYRPDDSGGQQGAMTQMEAG